jgi:hypothetical protein
VVALVVVEFVAVRFINSASLEKSEVKRPVIAVRRLEKKLVVVAFTPVALTKVRLEMSALLIEASPIEPTPRLKFVPVIWDEKKLVVVALVPVAFSKMRPLRSCEPTARFWNEALTPVIFVKLALVEKRFVLEAVVLKKSVEVAFEMFTFPIEPVPRLKLVPKMLAKVPEVEKKDVVVAAVPVARLKTRLSVVTLLVMK